MVLISLGIFFAFYLCFCYVVYFSALRGNGTAHSSGGHTVAGMHLRNVKYISDMKPVTEKTLIDQLVFVSNVG